VTSGFVNERQGSDPLRVALFAVLFGIASRVFIAISVWVRMVVDDPD
jgi:hypothetical protein